MYLAVPAAIKVQAPLATVPPIRQHRLQAAVLQVAELRLLRQENFKERLKTHCK